MRILLLYEVYCKICIEGENKRELIREIDPPNMSCKAIFELGTVANFEIELHFFSKVEPVKVDK